MAETPTIRSTSSKPASIKPTSTARSAALVSSLTVVSRFLGFIRDLLVARMFGASPVADAFFVAFRIPNVLRSFVAEGAMTSAFLPVFTSELKESRAAAQSALSSFATLLLTVTLALALLGSLYAEPLIEIIAPGFRRDPEQFALCVQLTQLMLPFVICVSFVALLNGALNASGIFGAAAMAQVFMNACLILGAVLAQFMEQRAAAVILAVSVLAGGLVQVVSQLPALRKAGFQLKLSRSPLTPASRKMLTLVGPALIGAAVYQIGIFLNTVFASTLETGSVSWLFYADRLVQLPIGIFSIALASVLLPALSHASADKDESTFVSKLQSSLRITSFVIFPVSCGLFFFAPALVSVAFERGAFDALSVARTSSAIQAYAFGIWAMSIYSLLSRAFIARQDTVTPMVIGLFSLSIVVFSSLVLMGNPSAGHPPEGFVLSMLTAAHKYLSANGIAQSYGHIGLALASSAGAWTSFLLAAILLSRRVSLSWLAPTLAALQCCSLGILATAIPQLVLQGSTAWTQVLVGVPVCVVLYVALSAVFGSKELKEMLALLRSIRSTARRSKSKPG